MYTTRAVFMSLFLITVLAPSALCEKALTNDDVVKLTKHRTADRSPAVLIAADHDPRSRYFVVRLDVNDKDGDRSLKMGKSGAFSFHASKTPDSEWTFPFEASEQKPGTWKLALRTALP